MKILITGAAGFIGYHLSLEFSKMGYQIVGLDNINDYYDVNLKYARLKQLGIERKSAEIYYSKSKSLKFKKFSFIRMDLEDRMRLPELFSQENFTYVFNLAAQVGVRNGKKDPAAYIDSNIVGFANLLECCRNYPIKHLYYASSSSVYGESKKVPFSTNDDVNHPISLYAATKKSNELLAYTYGHLYNYKTTGFRFFTVYGPWGRPDMAMYLFTNSIVEGRPIKVFNQGNLERDFTYIDDITNGISEIFNKSTNLPAYSIFNIGKSSPVKLLDFIKEIENQLKKSAIMEFMPYQPEEVSRTWADIEPIKKFVNYEPKVELREGIGKFLKWYCEYSSIEKE